MPIFAYVIPVIACLLLYFGFDYTGKWQTYLWLLLVGEATAGILHWIFYACYTSCTEYLGSIVSSIHYEEPWIELVETYETETDSKGNTRTVKKIDTVYHSEKFYFYTSLGSCIATDSDFYSYVAGLWNLSSHSDWWSGCHIKGGMRFGEHYTMEDFTPDEYENPSNWVPVTESHSYRNKIRRSNSIFKFEKISKARAEELGLYDYPEIEDHDAPCILSEGFFVDPETMDLFSKFNARYGEALQMRLYILLFEAEKGIAVSEYQRAYWQGRNKNEFIVCIGLDNTGKVEWARAFSWADEQDKEVATAQWLMDNPELDWQKFYDWFLGHISDWKRKEFKDFDYVQVSLPLWQTLSIYALCTLENALYIHVLLKP